MHTATALRPLPFDPQQAAAAMRAAVLASRVGRRATDIDVVAPEPAADWTSAVLDEIDYGVLVVSAEGVVQHHNRAARHDLDATHPLELLGSLLRARASSDREPLRVALHQAAHQGLRKLLKIGGEAEQLCISVVPLGRRAQPSAPAAQSAPTVLILLGKRQMVGQLSVLGYARSIGLTPTEGRVLAELCAGATAREVADMLGVALSTVRTHINSIRAKTGAGSICSLVRQMAVLPPLMGALGLSPPERASAQQRLPQAA
ncbi:MAG TPA: helix-turn-helix transcriptional regulator [Methylibium sp.]|uniref:helix-turn-helix transcriptional regulator n=1 Tax=Methylibium sp. TaxID=2067992 RepID=UPI002DB8721D|nr:helix-turn-helix transcriptional regulator [Methylibium sp.]HEU4458330.1 helix-turn-helix transcriptional regulator [Methylibium sp.]